jgi:ketoreductase RED2
MSEQPVALVTGSAAGIGAAIAGRLAEEGYRLVVNSVRSTEAGQKLADSLPGAIYLRADVSDPREASGLVTGTVERLGRLDVLVNNAGVTQQIPHSDLDAVTPQVWHEILDLNVIGTWQLTVAAMPHLREGGDGCIINVSSLAGSRQVGSSIPYAVSKAALDHMTRLLANTVGPEVRVNAVAPGLIDTEWTASWSDIRARVEKAAPLRRSGQPDDVADAVLGLVRSRYTTGVVVLVDGGMHLTQ